MKTIKYQAQELWHGQIYKGKKIENAEQREKRIKDIVNLSNNRLKNIASTVDGEFKSHIFADREINEVADVGTHIIFPLLVFEKKFNPSKITLECRIRINPCPERKEHYSKIWVIIGANSIQSSVNLKNFFKNYVKEFANCIGRKIEEVVYEAERISGDVLEDTEYPITIRNVGNSNISPHHDIFKLFEVHDKKEAIKLLGKPEVNKIVRDLLNLHGVNVTNKITMDKLQTAGIRWRTMKSHSYLGERNFLYGCKAEDQAYKIVGFSNVGELKYLHSLFKPTVLQMIYAL